MDSAHSIDFFEKSSNSRSKRLQLKTVQFVFRILKRTSPNLAANIAFRFSFYIRQFPCPDWEKQLLSSADEHILLPWGNGNISTWSWGEGPTILLVHGWEGRGSQLGHFIHPLVEKGFRVVTFDGPGHGQSSASRASIINQANSLCHIAEFFGGTYAVVAHSMGAAALTYATAKQKIKAKNLVLIAPPVDSRNFYKTLSQILQLEPEITSLITQRAEREFDISIDDLYLLKYASSLQIPAFVVQDKDDKFVSTTKSIELAKAWPKSELLLTEGLGHHRILNDPEVIKSIVDFIT